MKALLFGGLALLLSGGTVRAQNVVDRVHRLETEWQQQKLQEIERNAKVAQAVAELERIRVQFNQMSGGKESQEVLLGQLREEQNRRARDLEMQIQSLAAQLTAMESVVQRAVARVAPDLEKERQLFGEGLEAAKTGDCKKALAAFEQFNKKYPKSPLMEESLFWIGECRLAGGDTARAIKDYQKFVEKYPRSAKAPTAIYKQAEGFLKLGMKEEAKAFLQKLVKEYPSSGEAERAKQQLTLLAAPPPAPAVRERIENGDF